MEDRADSDCRRTIIQSFDKQRLRHYDFSIGRFLIGYFGNKRIDFSRLRNQGPAVNQEEDVLNSPLHRLPLLNVLQVEQLSLF